MPNSQSKLDLHEQHLAKVQGPSAGTSTGTHFNDPVQQSLPIEVVGASEHQCRGVSSDMAQQGRTRLPHKEDDSWTDHDSAIYMRSDSSSVESSSDTEGKFVVPLVQGEQLQEQREQATFLLNWQWKMDIARLDGRKYTWTETRLRNFQWSEEFYVDESGFLGVLAERANEQFRAAIADDPASYGAASCHWHKTKAPARLPRRKKTENEKEETPTVPKIVLTDPQGENWFLNDLRYYPDDFDEDDEEEEDESIYW